MRLTCLAREDYPRNRVVRKVEVVYKSQESTESTNLEDIFISTFRRETGITCPLNPVIQVMAPKCYQLMESSRCSMVLRYNI
jgi:hypothetical protein